jgi:FkbM family methyltransferase
MSFLGRLMQKSGWVDLNREISDPKLRKLAEIEPGRDLTQAERVAMTERCRDADDLPKVAGAGDVTVESGARIQTMFNGVKVVADGYYGAWMTDLITRCKGHHEPQEERVFHEVLRHVPDTASMIEIGGFWSFYTIWFLRGSTKRRATVLEPDPKHLAIGESNAVLNHVSPQFVQGFVGLSSATDQKFKTEESGEARITRYSIPDLMSRSGYEHLDILHCDAQGSETMALLGASDLLQQGRIAWVFVSTHIHQISKDPLTHQRCLNILRKTGGTVVIEHDPHESFSGDGLIVARYGKLPEDWQQPVISFNRASASLSRHLSYDLAGRLPRTERKPKLRLRSLRRKTAALSPVGDLWEITRSCALGEPGDKVSLRNDAAMSRPIIAKGEWGADVNLELARHLKSGTSYTLIDVGANIGAVSRQLLRSTPAIRHAYCFEPDVDNFACLSFNLAPFAGRVTLLNYGLSDREGSFQFWRDTENAGNYSLAPDAMRDRPSEVTTVRTLSAEDWFRTSGLSSCSDRLVWKSDTQGYDELIISNCPMDVWRRIDSAVIELWRIEKPAFDRDAFRARLEDFPNRTVKGLGVQTPEQIMDYLSGNDWEHSDLFLWR